MVQGNFDTKVIVLLYCLYCGRIWLNRDEYDDTYGTEVQYWCVNGSQFDVPGGPNISVEIK